MKKTFISVLLLSCSFSVFAQAESLSKLAADVQQLINANAENLDENDKIQVRKNLRQIINVFRLNGHHVPSSSSYICDSNNNQLIELGRGMIHDFSDTQHCQEALANVKVGKSFCDYYDNKLFKPDGSLVHDFSDSAHCREAIETITRTAKFCDYYDNTLRSADGTLLYDFSSREDCARNLN